MSGGASRLWILPDSFTACEISLAPARFPWLLRNSFSPCGILPAPAEFSQPLRNSPSPCGILVAPVGFSRGISSPAVSGTDVRGHCTPPRQQHLLDGLDPFG